MNSRNNSEKDNKNGWVRRDNRQQRFKKDFSSQDFYNHDWKSYNNNTNTQDWKPYNNNQDWKNKSKKTGENQPKVEKNYNIAENYSTLTSTEFKWNKYCLLE